jgi:tetratricopeptide (TPR) repeat protein
MVRIIGWLFYVIAAWFFLAGLLSIRDILKRNMPFKAEVPVMVLVTGFSLIFFLFSDTNKIHLAWILLSISCISTILRKVFKKNLENEIPISQIAEMQETVGAYSKAIKSDAADTSAYYNRGLAHASSGNYKRAIDDFNTVIRLDPKHESAFKNRGLAYAKLGNYYETINNFTELINLSNANMDVYYYDRAVAYFKSGNYQQAVNDFNKYLEVQPNDSQAYKDRGRAHFLLLDYLRAINDFDRVIELVSDDAEVYFFRGISRQKSGDYRQALTDIDTAARLGHQVAKDMLIDGATHQCGQVATCVSDFMLDMQTKNKK